MNRSQLNRIRTSLVIFSLGLSVWLLYSWPSLAQTPSEAYQGRWLNQETPSTNSDDLTVADLPTALQYTMSETMGAEEARYHIETEGDWPQVNSGGMLITFEASGPRVTVGQSELALELVSLGNGQAQLPVAAAHPQVEANRVEYQRGTLTEWYVNGPLGVQQGFTLAERLTPQTDAQLTLTLALSEGWQATVAADGRTASLIGSHGIRLSYGELFVYDATGQELAASLSVGQENGQATLQVQVDDQEARYPLTIDPFIQQTKLTASDGMGGEYPNIDSFGWAVDISGDTIVVGAPNDNNKAGAVYIFEKPVGGWPLAMTETAKLTATNGIEKERFGFSVAISGDTIVVGTYDDDLADGSSIGAAYIYEKPTGGWTTGTPESARITAPDSQLNDYFGHSVAIDGDVIVIGAFGIDNDKGAAYIYEKPENGWATGGISPTKLSNLNGEAGDVFGFSVAISNDTIIIGNPGNLNIKSAAYLYEKPIAGWNAITTESAKLITANAPINDLFGISVAISNETILVGAMGDNDNDSTRGAGYFYEKPLGGWNGIVTETAKLIASDSTNGDQFGFSIALSDGVIAIGANDHNSGRGATYLYEEPIGGWPPLITETTKLTAFEPEEYDFFGVSVAISNQVLVVGADGDDSSKGAAYIFTDISSPQIMVSGNGLEIDNGDTTPSPIDYTDFGITTINGNSVQRTFTISNTGNVSLNLSSDPKVALTGDGASDFIVTNDPISPVAANNSTSFTIQFDPSIAGTRVATVTIANNDDDKNPYTFAVQGAGTLPPSPEIVISGNDQEITPGDITPSSTDHTDFGSTTISSNSVQRTFTISNTGNASLNLSGSPKIALSGEGAGDFTIIDEPTSSVAAKGSTSFTIQFDPSVTGTRVATITIANNDADKHPYTFAIQGTGTTSPTPEIVISGNDQEIISGDTIPTPTDHTDFGSTALDSGSVQRTFTIANTGDADLIFSDVALTGLHSSDFTMIEQPVSPVAAKGSTSFTIQFTPSAVGLRTAQVSLTNNDSNESPYTFAIQGTGTAAKSSVYLPLLSKP